MFKTGNRKSVVFNYQYFYSPVFIALTTDLISCSVIYGWSGRLKTDLQSRSVTGQSAVALSVPAKAPCACIGFM